MVSPLYIIAAALAAAFLLGLFKEQWRATAYAVTLAAPSEDVGAFAAVVGGYAAAVDAGTAPGTAFSAAVASAGWEAVDPSAAPLHRAH